MVNALNDLFKIGIADYEENIALPPIDAAKILASYDKEITKRNRVMAKYIERHKKIMTKAIDNNLLTKDFVRLDENQLEELYFHAYDFFQAKKYQEALNLFRFLILLDISQYRFLYGLGKTLQEMNYNLMAVNVFMLAVAIEPENPVPYFNVADCSIFIEDTVAALFWLEKTIEVCDEQEKYQSLKNRATIMRDNILEQLKQAVK